MQNRSYGDYDAVFTAKIDAWTPFVRGFIDILGERQFEALNRSERTFNNDKRTIALLSFENRLASLGGLAAVMKLLPHYLKKSGENVILLTPLYSNIPKVKAAVENGVLRQVMEPQKFHLNSYEGMVSCFQDTDSEFSAFYISVEDKFTAANNPYSYDMKSDSLLDDSLVFCAAVPFVLRGLGFTKDVLFHAQDWETAPIALTSKFAVLDGLMENTRTVLTLHNSFDSGISDKKKLMFFGKKYSGCHTVLQCSIPLLNGPLTTVSTPFACELRMDPLQRTIFTDHLQTAFSMNPPVGIENGMFGHPASPFTYVALSRARQGDFSVLLEQKAQFRNRMFEIIKSMDHPDIIGGLEGVNDDTPILFMSGRLDLSQKGFDVMFQAFGGLPAGKVKLIFCPSSAEGNRGSKELEFFEAVAKKCVGDIVVWPFRVSSNEYASVQSGASFMLMPSFYEPFGAATEGFMHGTPVIARATGGLWVQVKPAGEVHIPKFYNGLFRCEECTEQSTGLLYREPIDGAEAQKGWKECLEAASTASRMKSHFYQSMVREASDSLSKAVEIYADNQAYGRMVLNGVEQLRRFSWVKAVEKYRKVYDTAALRGFF
ncbi:MAG: glycogen/starch synthase [Chitinispirillales bacterium]|jgi:glycogen synthase|nr:glycogen/starch synthase [Chitinispirillales bacterium]